MIKNNLPLLKVPIGGVTFKGERNSSIEQVGCEPNFKCAFVTILFLLLLLLLFFFLLFF